MDANSKGAADLLRALMHTAARFSDTGRSLSDANFPHVRWAPISDLAGRAVRLGLELTLPGHEIVFEMSVVVPVDGGFAVRGEIVLDGAEACLVLPLVETADVAACATTLDRYAEELIAPARRHVNRLLEECSS
ncbi:hypothetical protein [Sphaerimonospora thailandensis]|uniref:Uncharacterized protein n=1 Tax=Sphaerimonospora thailandensis TaxID=795644 RepID=A0A8J3VY36_9ACTN|nr:hypothetical protein [Sphaerimonospora thailandensis]GIH69092.1 hypothetical protein Mth01_13450 [Sphaerimonospora thailandensis]